MKKKCIIFVLFFLIQSITYAVSIGDISSQDGAYKAIKKTVKEGYLSLYNNKEFKPDQSLSRREASLIIDRILSKMDSKNPKISSTDISDLKELSKNFKSIYTKYENKISDLSNNNQALNEQQNLLHADISELSQNIEEFQKERKLLFGLIIAVGLLGILF